MQHRGRIGSIPINQHVEEVAIRRELHDYVVVVLWMQQQSECTHTRAYTAGHMLQEQSSAQHAREGVT